MEDSQFFICEEDNVFDELSALYEDLQPCPYTDAPGLDLSFEYEGAEEYSKQLSETITTLPNEQEYGINPLDVHPGDLVWASVYQEGQGRNPEHQARPFLVIYANAYMVYGFQLTTSSPTSLANYLVELPNWQSVGLPRPSKALLNLVRGVRQQYLDSYIGHITAEQRQVILNKLYEIQDDVDGIYANCLLNDRLDMTIENVWRIRC